MRRCRTSRGAARNACAPRPTSTTRPARYAAAMTCVTASWYRRVSSSSVSGAPRAGPGAGPVQRADEPLEQPAAVLVPGRDRPFGLPEHPRHARHQLVIDQLPAEALREPGRDLASPAAVFAGDRHRAHGLIPHGFIRHGAMPPDQGPSLIAVGPPGRERSGCAARCPAAPHSERPRRPRSWPPSHSHAATRRSPRRLRPSTSRSTSWCARRRPPSGRSRGQGGDGRDAAGRRGR